MKYIVIAFFFLYSFQLTAQTHPVELLDQQLNRFIVEHNVNQAETLYHNLFTLQASGGLKKYKADMLKDIGNNALTLEINETTDVKILQEGKTVVLTGVLRQKGKWNDKPFDYTLQVTDTWVKTKRGWKLLAGHASIK